LNKTARIGDKSFFFQDRAIQQNMALGGLFAATMGAAFIASRGRRPIHFHTMHTKGKIPPFSHLITPFARAPGYIEPFRPYDRGQYRDQYYDRSSVKASILMGSMVPLLEQISQTECSSAESPSNVPLDHPLRAQICDKIIAEQADFLIRGTNLEGFLEKPNKEHLETFMRFYADQGGISEESASRVLHFLQGLQIIVGESPEIAKEIATKVFSLNPGETFAMQGGWMEKSGDRDLIGHSMVFTFTKREDGNYDIKLYNTGSGIGKYHMSKMVTDGMKEKQIYCPYVAFESVPPAFLGFRQNTADSGFFQKLVDLGQGRYADLDKTSCDLIYASPDFFGNFPGRIVEPGPGTPFITSQRSGTCTWKVLTAAIRHLFATEEEYKKFKLMLKYTDFFIFFEKLQGNVSPQNKKLLIEEAAKILRSIDKCRDFLPEEQIQKMQKAIYVIQGEIANFPIQSVTIPTSIEAALDQTVFALKAPIQKTVWDVSEAKEEPSILYKELLQKPKVNELLPYLQKIRDLKKEDVRRYTTEQLAKTLLEFSDADWETLSKEEMGQVVELLCENLTQYLDQERICFDDHGVNSIFFTEKAKNAAWTFVAIAYKLSCLCYPSLTEYSISYNRLSDVYPFIPKSSREEIVQYKKIVSLFAEEEGKKELFDFSLLKKCRIYSHEPLSTDAQFLWKIAYPDATYKPSPREIGRLLSWSKIGDPICHVSPSADSAVLKLIGNLRGIAYLANITSAKSNNTSIDDFRCCFIASHTGSYVDMELSALRELQMKDPEAAWIKKEFFQDKKENAFILEMDKGLAFALALRTVVENLRCSILVYLFGEKGSKHTSEEEELFVRLLFQPHKNPMQNPPIFTALKDPAFVAQLTDFLVKGVEFASRQRGVPFYDRLLYLQINQMAGGIDPDLSLPSFRNKINEWLKEPKHSQEKKKSLHLQRILQYKPQALRGLSSEELEEVVQSWLLCSQHFFKIRKMDASQKKEASRFIMSLAPQLEKISDKSLDRIVSYVLGIDDISALQEGPWNTSAFPIYKKGPWEINLLLGTLKENGMELKLGSQKRFSNTTVYGKIFGEKEFSFKTQRGVYEFTDETGQKFRFSENDNKIYINFDKKWHEYVETDQQLWPKRGYSVYDYFATTYDVIFLGNERFPSFLLSDHYCFAKGGSRIFLDKKTREIAFVLQEDGQLINHRNHNKVAHTEDVKTPALDVFEPAYWRIYELDAKGQKIIRFPRFQISSGGELRLIQTKEGQIVLEDNPNFFLIPPIQGIIGECKNILCFYRPATKEIKVFVPMVDAQNPYSLAPADSLVLNRRMLENGEGEKPQGKRFQIAQYTYKKGLIPKDREAKAFLSYLYLTQKKEKEALALLESLGRERILLPFIKTILSSIVNLSLEGSNQTPAAVALGLKAGLLGLYGGMKFMVQREKEVVDLIKELISKYRNTYDNIPEGLRLTQRELENLAHFGYPLEAKQGERSIPLSDSDKEGVALSGGGGFVYDITNVRFRDLYETMRAAKTVEESRAVLAGAQLNVFDRRLGNIFLTIQGYREKSKDLEIPALPDFNALWEESYYWRCQFQQGKFKGIPLYSLVPGHLGKKDSEPLMAKGKPLRSLQEALLEVQVPSPSRKPLDKVKIDPPKVNLQTECVKPYFIEIQPIQKKKTTPLKLGAKAPPLHVKAISEVNKEIAIGREINTVKSSWALKSGQSLDTVKQELRKKLEKFEAFLLQSKQSILDLANEKPHDLSLAERSLALEKGQYKHTVQFEELITAYLRGDYARLNPHLREDQRQELDKKIREFLIYGTKAQQMERALEEKEPHLVAAALDAKMAYSPTKKRLDRVCLVYEYREGLRIRKEQRDAIQNMLENKDVVQQMIMGGGKTTVLTAIVLEMVDPGKIPIFIALSTQFDTQVDNLSKKQYEHYTRQIIPMNYTREELTLNNLHRIEKQLNDAKTHHEAIVTTPATLPSLQLEWLSLLDKDPEIISEEEQKKINCLGRILSVLRKDGCVLLDEVDQILDVLKELNFPIGDRQPIDPMYTDLIEKIFVLHLDPKVESTLGLMRNEQASLSTEQYKAKILPLIVNQFFNQYYSLFQLDDSWKEACKKYVLKGVETPALRELLEKRRQGEDDSLQKATQLIFLAKGLFVDLLPSIMSRVENKNFGIAKETKERKIIPFLGVDSPSNTEFAGPFETICYHYAASLSNPITKLQLKTWADTLIARSLEATKYTRQELKSTVESARFFRLTGVSLERIEQEDESALEEALEYLQKDPLKRLELEKEFIQANVGTYAEYYRSNPQSLCNLFFSTKSFSGTLPNLLTFPEKLRRSVHLEKGAGGRILDVFLTRVEEGTCRVYQSKTEDISQMLTSALTNNPRKEQFRMFLDPAGTLKYKENIQVAKEILTHFETDPKIQGVLFFGRVKGNMGVPSTLMIMKKPRGEDGNFSIEIVGGTTKEALDARGVDPATTITYCDERHCEATDIPQILNALGLVTVNSRLLDRDFLQTNLRLRKYLETQDIDLLVLEKELKNYPSPLTGREVLMQMEIVQKERTAEEGFTGFIQKMDEIFREKGIAALAANATHNTMKLVRDLVVVKEDFSPYAQFGRVQEKVSPLEGFDQCRAVKEKQHQWTSPELDDLREGMQENIDDLAPLVAISESKTSAGVGSTRELQVEQQQQVERQREAELEYWRHQQGGYTHPFDPISWKLNEVFSIEETNRSGSGPKIMPLQDVFRLGDRSYYYYRDKKYHELFQENGIFVSENFVYTDTSALSVFSMHQKSAEQILITEDEKGVRALLLSQEEGAYFKKQIQEGKLLNAWLYLPNEHMHVFPKEGRKPEDQKKLDRILLEINLFNGNGGYLISHKEELKEKIGSQKELIAPLLRFVSLKSYEGKLSEVEQQIERIFSEKTE
jgi:hypothetical protein